MNYQETIAFLFQQLPMYQRVGASAFKKDLTNITALTKHLGDPQNQFESIHIAGTNGKGTTTHILASIFQSEGYKVGCYTSPHYKDFRERIKINGDYISKEKVVRFVEKIRPAIIEIKPSFFEITVAMAFDYFASECVDIAIIETGLGGRLDSTNIITPKLSIITNISLDHQAMLGNTLPEIASEKAGIIKKNIPVIVGEREDSTQEVFIKKAKDVDAQILFGSDIVQVEMMHREINHDHYQVSGVWSGDIVTDIKGPFQYKNIATSLAAMHLWNQSYPHQKIGWNTIIEAMTKVKSTTNYIGRWEVLDKKPLTITDSAHNEAGIKYALQSLASFDYDQLHIVLGFVKDKSLESILSLFPVTAKYYFSSPKVVRGLDSKLLKKQASIFALEGKSYESIHDAWSAAKQQASEKDLIYIGGSTFVVAEVI